MHKIGQYFTEDEGLQLKVRELCINNATALEPSAGEGHLVAVLEDKFEGILALELDNTLTAKHCTTAIMNMDFFDFPMCIKVDTVFGNPPFLKQSALPTEIKKKMEEDSILSNCNIFYNFIEKSFHHLNEGGELVFIIPREFVNSTRATPLRELLFKHGTITNFIDYEEQKLFKDAAPSIIIIRYEKGNLSHKTLYERGGVVEEHYEVLNAGSYLFTKEPVTDMLRLSHFFDVKVGIVTGLNKVYENAFSLSIPVICSDYFKTRLKRHFIYADEYSLEEIKEKDILLHNYLNAHKDVLIGRKIKSFTENNWWYWGAIRNIKQMREVGSCIYVNAKTREQKPFFVEEKGYYDGSMLALYPKNDEDVFEWCDTLNDSVDEFKTQGLYVNNKYSFTVKTLLDFLV